MIKNWSLKNFKSVYDQTKLELAPLTIFAGANSSGKSTLIQSLLLTAQTIQSPVHSRSIILNGHIIRLGTFNDIISNGSRTSEISIGFELAYPGEEQKPSIQAFPRRYFPRYHPQIAEALSLVECQFSFSVRGPKDSKDVLQLQPRLEECSIRTIPRGETPHAEEIVHIRRSKKNLDERLEELQLSSKLLKAIDSASLEYDVVKSPTQQFRRIRRFYDLPVSGKPVGATLLHFLPERISIVFDSVEEQARQLYAMVISPDDFRYMDIGQALGNQLNDIFKKLVLQIFENVSVELNLETRKMDRFNKTYANLRNDFSFDNFRKCHFSLPSDSRRFLTEKFTEKRDNLIAAAKGDRPPEFTIAHMPLPELSDSAADYIQQFFSRYVKYLGPLRDEPKPVYPLAGAIDPRDIGFKGEHTAAVLEVHRNTQIKYIPSRQFVTDNSTFSMEQTTLFKAVLDWLGYMGIANSVQTIDKGTLGHELKVATSNSDALHDLIHVGVGVSQVLPILVLALLAEQGSTLIFEQPELHLHPRVQTRLADFFISMTLLNKQCIVETHSEYLISQLRYRAVMSENDYISNKAVIYFVEKEDRHSKYQCIRLDKYGVISNWPRGFFDENAERAAAILKAAREKKQRESNK